MIHNPNNRSCDKNRQSEEGGVQRLHLLYNLPDFLVGMRRGLNALQNNLNPWLKNRKKCANSRK
jgi:hypothetical protein